MKILLQAIKSLIRKVELVAQEASEEIANYFGNDGIIKRQSLPDGYPYMTVSKVLPSTTFTDVKGQATLGYALPIGENVAYTVDWNGTSYSCVSFPSEFFGINVVVLGSEAGTGESTYPFCIMTVDIGSTSDAIIYPLDGSTTFTIAITGPKYKKIHAAYLPRLDAYNIQNGEGDGSICSIGAFKETGNDALAFGSESKASGYASFTLGYICYAEGGYSFAMGQSSYAAGIHSFAFGSSANAYGDHSFAKGNGAYANGDYSHAEGREVTASGNHQFVFGKYNIEDTENKYSLIVGNGDFSNRSNAHTLDWEGNAWFAGTVEGTALILSSPNGTRYKITVDDSGTLSATAI